MSIHRKTELNQRHKPWRWEFADEAERSAVTGLLESDEKKWAIQLDDFSVWVLTDYSVPEWEGIGSAAPDPVPEGVYIFGGAGDLLDADQYIPDTWTVKTDMPVPGREALACTSILAKGYIFGGYASAANIADTDEYDPNDVWTSKTDLIGSGARRAFTSSTILDKGYIFCGYTSGVIQSTDEYSPDTWTAKTNAPSPARFYLGSCTILDKGYIFCGYNSSFVFTKDTDEYSPDVWTSKTDMPLTARGYAEAVSILDKGYLIGGRIGSTSQLNTQEYSPDTWTAKTNMPSPARDSAPVSELDDKGYICCGYSTGTAIADCDEYSPDTWVSKTNAAPTRYNHSGASI